MMRTLGIVSSQLGDDDFTFSTIVPYHWQMIE